MWQLISARRVLAILGRESSGKLHVIHRVMVCWEGGRNAARALADAMPFLARAKASKPSP